jgi:hypothetical protein
VSDVEELGYLPSAKSCASQNYFNPKALYVVAIR